MRASILSTFTFVTLIHGAASAEPKVAIGEVTGPTGAQVGYAVEQALRDKLDVVANRVWEQTAQSMSVPPDDEASLQPVGRELGADAVVVGDVSRVGRKWQAELRVYEVNSGQFSKDWTFDTSSLRNLSKIARRQAFTQLGAAIRAAEAAEPAAPPEPAAGAPPPGARTPKRVVILPWPGGGRADNVRKVAVQSLRSDPGFELVDEYDAIGKAREIGVILKQPVGRVAVAELMEVDAYVFGEVFYRRGWHYAAVEVYQGVDGAQVEIIKLKRRGQVALGNAVVERLVSALRRAEGPVQLAPAPEPAPSTAAAPRAETEPGPAAEARTEREKRRRPRGADARSRTPLEVSLGFTSFFRTFDFNEPLTPQRPYEASFAPAIALAARWYPAAHFTDAWYRNLGVDISADYAIGLSSEDSVTGSKFPTNSFSFIAGLRGRLPLGPSELGAVVSFGTDRFSLDPTEQGAEAETPSVEYVFARFGGDGRIRIIPQLDFGFGGGLRLLTDAGEIISDDWFPRAEVGAFDVTAKLGTPIFDPIHLELGANYIHYFFAFNPTVDDAQSGRPIAGGALDQYTEIFLRAVLVL